MLIDIMILCAVIIIFLAINEYHELQLHKQGKEVHVWTVKLAKFLKG